MKSFIALLAFVVISSAKYIELPIENTVYGYFTKYGIPLAEKIRTAEESYDKSQRIIGGTSASLRQYPHQVGVLSRIDGFDGIGVCSGSLISDDRVVTAAHCWFDGENEALQFTVVLGSITIFSGGLRVNTSNVVTHPYWSPYLIRNDIAVAYLPQKVTFTETIAPIALPSGFELINDFIGATVTASGFGLTSETGTFTMDHVLSYVSLDVISNSLCSLSYPVVLHSGHICTSGFEGRGACRGDSGGPLIVESNGTNILIGITSFGHELGCESNSPSVFTRVTSYISFINEHL